MAENKKSFIAYSDWIGVFKALPDEVAGKLIKHIFAYVNDENPASDDYIINALFEPIKATLKRDLRKWEVEVEQRRLAGLASAAARRTKSNDRSIPLNESERNPTDSVSVSVSDNVNDSDTKEKRGVGKNIPSFEEFLEHAVAKNPRIDKTHVRYKYDSWVENGWKDGLNKPIKNWRSKLTNNIPFIKESQPQAEGRQFAL